MDGVDPARVWAFVANPANLAKWAPARRTGFLGTELPAVGHTMFLHRRHGDDPDRAWRCTIDEWEAGHRIRCRLETPGAAQDQSIEVIVETRGTGPHASTGLGIHYRADVPAGLAPLYRWRVRSMVSHAIRSVAAAVAR
jgi:uncharacterized protein YndB with AHSA1/START domain